MAAREAIMFWVEVEEEEPKEEEASLAEADEIFLPQAHLRTLPWSSLP